MAEQGLSVEGELGSPLELKSAYIFDLDTIMREASQLTLSQGRATSAIVSFPNLKLFVIYMPAESVWSEHSTPGRIAVQVLRGHVVMTGNGKRYDLSTGCGAAFDSDIKHDVHALSEACAYKLD
jgi:quercetin dioxygenase-like cupin family protein